MAVWWRAGKLTLHAHRTREHRVRLLIAFKDSIWGLALLVIIMGGIYGGVFTPTEAAAVAAVYATVVAVFVYRDIGVRQLPEVLLDAGRTTVMLMFIVANALLFAHVLTTERIPQTIAEHIMAAGMAPWMFLLVVNIILLVAGNFMEPTGIILILAPIFFPIAIAPRHRPDPPRHHHGGQHGDRHDHAAGGAEPVRHQRHHRHEPRAGHARGAAVAVGPAGCSW